MHITASNLYNYLQCPHRVWRDAHGPKEERIEETNPFVQLLWDKGLQHEDEVVKELGEFEDISDGTYDERFEKTLKAMKNGVPLIYQGLIKHDNLLGIPDLLKRLPDGNYVPVDIKSGMGFQGADPAKGKEGKQKKHYAAQLSLYVEILEKLGFSKERRGRIIDISKEEVEYDLESQWDFYEKTKKYVEFLLKNEEKNKPAIASICGLCPWYNSCKKWCEDNKDLTNIFYLGRSNRDRINEDILIENIDEFLEIDIEEVMKEKKAEKKAGNKDFLYRVGESSLEKAIRRGKILYQTKKPVLYGELTFPETTYELFFDIEGDPTQEFIYMHGVYERKGDEERYIDFTAKEFTREAEEKAWAEFWEYIDGLSKDDFSVYYYAHYEKTTYKKLQKKYPEVISLEKVEEFFDNPNVIDLYQVVLKHTDWPAGSYSLKALAVYLGFEWRDESPSGALSIQWFNEYLEKKDPDMLQRILDYNEDDCKATMVLKDAIGELLP